MLLYIDPGTGSMLFSVLIGAAATLFFLAKALVLKLKLIFSGRKGELVVDKSYKPYVIYCEDKRYWTVFKNILDEFEKRQTEVTYLVSKEDDPVFAQNYKYVKTEVIGEGNRAFAKLNMMSAGIILMTTPGLQVYQLKRSKNVKHYCHILHASTDATMYRLFGLDYFDSVLCTGDYQFEDIRALEKMRGLPQKELVTVGSPYLDTLKEKMKSIPEEKKKHLLFLFHQAGERAHFFHFTGKSFWIRFHSQDLKLLYVRTRRAESQKMKFWKDFRKDMSQTKMLNGILNATTFIP